MMQAVDLPKGFKRQDINLGGNGGSLVIVIHCDLDKRQMAEDEVRRVLEPLTVVDVPKAPCQGCPG